MSFAHTINYNYMDPHDAIVSLARSEARCLRPVRYDEEEEEGASGLPYICIRRLGVSQYTVHGRGHEGHENEGRMPFMCSFIANRVLPLIDAATNVSGDYKIELHDSYSYLPEAAVDASKYNNCMVFSRSRYARERSVLIPDPFHMADFNGLLSVKDTVPFNHKKAELFFAGTTTGNRDPQENVRVRACVWSLAHRGQASFHITKIAQMQERDLFSGVPQSRQIVRPFVPVQEHFNYRYQVNIVGNTACWSRVPMIMNSSCVMINLRHDDTMWYYPALLSGTHFVSASSLDDLIDRKDFLEANPNECIRITSNANRFVRDFLSSPKTAAIYMANMLEESSTMHKH